MSRASLRSHLLWLRHESRLEGLWIAALGRNGAGEDLVAEHATRRDRLDRLAASAEGRIAEIA
jgi:hypothetical protein